MIKVAIDLSWIRHGIVGGTEAYAMNLLDGFVSLADPEIEYLVIISKENENLFQKYKEIKGFSVFTGNFPSSNRILRVLWQNTRLNSILMNHKVAVCIEPVYLKPFFVSKKTKYITTVHDLQAAHYPEFFSRLFVLWMKIGWKNAIKTSQRIMVTSEYVKKDILARYNVEERQLVLNYDPVTVYKENIASSDNLSKYGVKENEYYYMVSSLLPHKNIDTVIKALGILKETNSRAFFPLVISGVGGKSKSKLFEIARECGVEENVIITPFIDEEERNLLYKCCRTYLAPSLFEGFGLPPIEAMIMGAPLLSTYETCSFEVSEGIAEYVRNAKDPSEWADKLDKGVKQPDEISVLRLKEKYSKESVARIFNTTIKEIV